MIGEITRAMGVGVRLALAYNPVLALVGAVIAAAMLSRRRPSIDRAIGGWSALVVAWLVGDGMRIIARARDAFDGAGALTAVGESGAAVWIALASWAALGLALGYIAPAWAGLFVGRRVTHGTGWLAAASVAVAVSLALTTLAGTGGVGL